MILDLKGVFECEDYSRDYSYKLDFSAYENELGEFPFKDPVNVSAEVRNRAGVVSLHVDADAVYSTECDRCCEPLSEKLRVSFDNVLAREADSEGDNGDIIVVSGDGFDLDELVSTNLILNIPMKHLCSESCKGLCPVCGKNLNKGSCNCEKPGNSPFNVLKDLIK